MAQEPPDPKLLVYRVAAADFLAKTREWKEAASRLHEAARQWDPESAKEDPFVLQVASDARWLLALAARSPSIRATMDAAVNTEFVPEPCGVAGCSILDHAIADRAIPGVACKPDA